jgi:hypothetical protein
LYPRVVPQESSIGYEVPSHILVQRLGEQQEFLSKLVDKLEDLDRGVSGLMAEKRAVNQMGGQKNHIPQGTSTMLRFPMAQSDGERIIESHILFLTILFLK